MPEKGGLLVAALAPANERLRRRVEQRVGQNHRLLGRALERLRQSPRMLIPACVGGKGVPESAALVN